MQRTRKQQRHPALPCFSGRPTNGLNDAPLSRLAAGGMLTLLAALPLSAMAQNRPSGRNTSPQPGIRANVLRPTSEASPVGKAGMALNISAESAPYHLDWNGTSGTLTRRALGAQPEVRLPLTYIHSEPGPKGYSKYLAWFLARDKDHFSIVWAYLNDGGREFFCWLYQYPSNQLTSLRFTGDYRFAPLPEPVAPTQFAELSSEIIPSYTGPDFKYRDWTRRSGLLDTLQLQPSSVTSFAAPLEQQGIGNRGQGTATPQSAIGNRQSAIPTASKSVSGLRIYPLHEIQVAKGNGWREGGWRELHSLAYDSANDPYYLIMYSNVTKGYVVDLKRAQTYVADFGATVVFSNDNTVFGAKEEMIVGPPDARIRRYARTEIPLVTTQKYANPYSNVDVYMDFHGPDGKTVSVPGYWDGGQTWRVRFTPTLAGRYSWRSYSTDTELGDQIGSFTCVADDTNSRGFVTVNAQRFYPHSFASANGLPFFPVFLRDPVHYFPAPDTAPSPATAPKVPAKAPASAGGEVSLIVAPQDNGVLPGQDIRMAPGQSNPLAPMQDKSTGAGLPSDPFIDDPTLLDLNPQNTPRTFTAFTRRVDDAAAVGFNRFWGGWLLDPTLFSQHKQANEGGAPFLNYDLDTINPAYFQWMDRRIAYCNERGIVPDIGITDIGASLLQEASPIQISRLWKYALARYSAFNVNWNLFGKSPSSPYPPDVNSWVEPLATLTDHYDPVGHPLTLVVPNSAPQAVVTPPAGAPTGAPTIIRPDNPVIIRPDVPGNGGAGSNPTLITPQTPLPNAPLPGTPGSVGTSRSAGTPGNTATPGAPTAPNAPQTSGSTRRNRNRGNNGAGNSGSNNGGQNSGRSAASANRRGANATGRATGTGTQVPNAPSTNSSGQTAPGSPANRFPQHQGAPNGVPANGFPANGFPANGFPANGFPTNGFPAGGQFPNRAAGANMGMAQGTGSDPRMQGRGSRLRGGRGRNGFGGFGGNGANGGAVGATEVTGNTTSNDYITNVDPDVAAALHANRAAQHGPAQPTSVPIVRYARADWLDVITLAGGDLSSLKYDYNLNKPLVVQDVTGADVTDATRHRLWETVMQGGFWQGAATANTGVADPLNSALARWQLACARLFKQTQYTRLTPHQDMIGGPEESPFERRRRKRAQAEATFENAQPTSGAATTDPGNVTGRGTTAPTTPGNPNFPGRAGGTGGQNAPGTPNAGGQPFPDLNGGEDEFGNDFPGGFQTPMPAVPAKATPGAIYVLADPGWEYVVYFESGGAITLDLLESIGTIRQSWFNPRTGEYASQETMKGGIYKTFTAPDSNDWVLLLSRRPEVQPQRNTGTVRTASDIR